MKLLGHAWVAVNAHPKGNRKLLILGSIIPEIMFYIKNHPFKYEEIHEGGGVVFKFLKVTNPKWADFGLGMISHSCKWGADRFNDDKYLALLGFRKNKSKSFRQRLERTFGLTAKVAKSSAHNILELAVELKIAEENPEFVIEFKKAVEDKKSLMDIKNILSNCFHKPYQDVSESVDELIGKTRGDFKSAEGLSRLWIELTSEFKWKLDESKLAKLIKELSQNYQGKEKVFLAECIGWTKRNLQPFVAT